MQTATPNVNTVFTKDQEELLDYIADYTANAFAEYFDEPEDEQRLLDELSDIGIESKEDFDDRYEGHFDNCNAEAEFAEQLMVDCCDYITTDHPLYNFIDWQDVWDRLVRFDYNTIQDVYFFRNA
jgi:hypothetical protein